MRIKVDGLPYLFWLSSILYRYLYPESAYVKLLSRLSHVMSVFMLLMVVPLLMAAYLTMRHPERLKFTSRNTLEEIIKIESLSSHFMRLCTFLMIIFLAVTGIDNFALITISVAALIGYLAKRLIMNIREERLSHL